MRKSMCLIPVEYIGLVSCCIVSIAQVGYWN